MFLTHAQQLVTQLRNYISVTITLLKDIFQFKRSLMIQVLAFSVVGTSLQALGLGATFFILKHLDADYHVAIWKILPFIKVSMHIIPLFAGVMILIGIAAFSLYKAETLGFKLARDYVNHVGSLMVELFPLIVHRLSNQAIHPKTGVPMGFLPELKRLGRLEIGVRIIIRVPTFSFQVLYGLIFLMYLEPSLIMILLIAVTPLLAPLRRMAWVVKESEKERALSLSSQSDAIKNLIDEDGRYLLVPGCNDRDQKRPIASAFAVPNQLRYKRLVAQAGSKAIGSIALIITCTICVFYFWLFYSWGKTTIALVVTYLAALRMTVTSGRQFVVQMAGFARFYEQVLKFFEDMAKTVSHKASADLSQRLEVAGQDLATDDGNNQLIIEDGGPYAVIGTFPLSMVNRYVLSVMFSKLNKRKRVAVVSRMAIIHEDPKLDMDLSWRTFLGADPTVSRNIIIEETLMSCCHFLNAKEIGINFDKPMKNIFKNRELVPQEKIEIVLLRIYFMPVKVVVFREQALVLMGDGAVGHWARVLADRTVLIYYHYCGQQLGRWGERYMVLVNGNAEEPCGVASVEWGNEHPDKVSHALRGYFVDEDMEDEFDMDDGLDDD